ncbi:MAG: sensor histidine kinase [Paracoccaceae bacterium]
MVVKPYSLRRRLLLWILLATLALGLLALIDTWREALRTAQSVSDRVLVGSALAIAERVTVDESGGLEVDIPFSSLEMLTSTAQDKVFYRVDGPVGHFLTGYPDLATVAAPPGGVAFADGVYGDVGIRSATLMREVSTGAASIRFSVTVAESTRARSALARSILVRSALRLVVLVLGVATLVWVAVTVALRPLEKLGEAIAERSPGDLRPVTADTPDEVEPLVSAINLFMDRLQTALDALRNFTGNASHQLRTPLAVVRTQLALIDRSTGPDAATAASTKAISALERAERVLSHLLVLARVDASAGAATLASIDLVATAKDLTSEMVPAALAQNIDLGFEGPAVAQVLADPILLAELLRNLVSNAIAYAGQGAVVTVRVVAQPDQVLLQVEDNGPGLTDHQMAIAVQSRRGSSRPLPHLRGEGATGMGLGLAVAVEISALFGTSLCLERPMSGTGLLASIAFTPTAG